MYVRGPQHSITGGDLPPVYSSGGGGNNPPLCQDRCLCYHIHLFGDNSMMIYYSLAYPICLCNYHLYTA